MSFEEARLQAGHGKVLRWVSCEGGPGCGVSQGRGRGTAWRGKRRIGEHGFCFVNGRW